LLFVLALVDSLEHGKTGLLGIGDGKRFSFVGELKAEITLRTGFLQADSESTDARSKGRRKVNLPPQTAHWLAKFIFVERHANRVYLPKFTKLTG